MNALGFIDALGLIPIRRQGSWAPSIWWILCLLFAHGVCQAERFRPFIASPWWRIASNPQLGDWTSPKQEPVDFAIWQAADGSWQCWACIRNTRHPGKTRIFHRWEGNSLLAPDWEPKGITFTGDGRIGETIGGMQAPYVIVKDGEYRMYYGDYRHICLAISKDGKIFEKKLIAHGMSGLFGEGPTAMARDPMLLRVGNLWHCYYAAHLAGRHGIWLRTSEDLERFGPSTLIMTGGQAGDRWWHFECPFVVPYQGAFYLFHTQNYAVGQQQTSVVWSENPAYFGVDEDGGLVGHLEVAAPEIVAFQGKMYLAALQPELDGIRVAELGWRQVE